MRTHLIVEGVVVNTILASVAESEAAFPDAICLDAEAHPGAIGWAWDGEALVAPPPVPAPVVVPASLTPLQTRKVLCAHGLLSQVQAAVAQAGAEAQEAWEYANAIQRTDPLVVSLMAALGKSPAQIDALFIEGDLL